MYWGIDRYALSRDQHYYFILHNRCIPIIVINKKANVFICSAVFTVMFGTNMLYISFVKLLLLRFVWCFVNGHPLNITHINEIVIGTYTPYLKYETGQNGILNIPKNINKCTTYNMSILSILSSFFFITSFHYPSQCMWTCHSFFFSHSSNITNERN